MIFFCVYILYTHGGPPFIISSKGLSVSLSLITLYNWKTTRPESGHPCWRHHGRACSLSIPVGWKSGLWSGLVNCNPEPTSGRKTIHWRLVDGRHFQRKQMHTQKLNHLLTVRFLSADSSSNLRMVRITSRDTQKIARTLCTPRVLHIFPGSLRHTETEI